MGTAMPPNLLLAAKLVVLAFLATGQLGGLPDHFLPFLGFFRHLDTAAWMRGGTANNNPITVRALAYLIGGHTEHHLEILKSRYLAN